MKLSIKYIFLSLLALTALIGCSSEAETSDQHTKSVEALSTEHTTEHFTVKDIYQNIQKGKAIASIYAVTTELSDYDQMESYASQLAQSDEKYLIVYFLDKHADTDSIEMKGVLLNPDMRPHCKAVYERTPGVESFTPLPFDS